MFLECPRVSKNTHFCNSDSSPDSSSHPAIYPIVVLHNSKEKFCPTHQALGLTLAEMMQETINASPVVKDWLEAASFLLNCFDEYFSLAFQTVEKHRHLLHFNIHSSSPFVQMTLLHKLSQFSKNIRSNCKMIEERGELHFSFSLLWRFNSTTLQPIPVSQAKPNFPLQITLCSYRTIPRIELEKSISYFTKCGDSACDKLERSLVMCFSVTVTIFKHSMLGTF